MFAIMGNYDCHEDYLRQTSAFLVASTSWTAMETAKLNWLVPETIRSAFDSETSAISRFS